MIEFQTPYLIPMIFLFLVLCIGFAMGNIWSEVCGIEATRADHDWKELRWLLLIVPSFLGIFVILWWPTVYLGSG